MHEATARFRTTLPPTLSSAPMMQPGALSGSNLGLGQEMTNSTETPVVALAISDLHHAATRIERAGMQAMEIADRFFGPSLKGESAEKLGDSDFTLDRLRNVIARINYAIDRVDDELARLARI